MKAIPIRLVAATAFLVALVTLQPRIAPASHSGWLFGTGNRVVITMTEYPFRFTPNTITLESGKAVDLVLENKGTSGTHIFMVYPPPKTPPKLFVGWSEYVMTNTYFQDMGEILIHVKPKESYVAATRVFEVGVGAGQTITISFVPSRKGRFEFASHIASGRKDGDYEQGMKGTLVVK